MQSRVLCTILSAFSMSLGGPVVFAIEYSVQGGDAHMQSKWEGRNSDQSHCMKSAVTVALLFGSMSNEITSQPASAKAFPTDPVPENNSSSLGILFAHEKDRWAT
jgi:hypothetical protein